MKYLEMHQSFSGRRWQELGTFLCNEFGEDDIFKDFFMPTEEEMTEHCNDGYDDVVWGELLYDMSCGKYNEFRQNIVLLMAAMNGEL
jgi:hypothetical protein